MSTRLQAGVLADKTLNAHQRQCEFETLEPRVLLSGDVIISEFMALNQTILADSDGDYSDWVELHNAGDQAVDIEGWFLTDDTDDFGYPQLDWQLPNITLDPDEYVVIFASGKNMVTTSGEIHTDFSLSGSGEYLALVMADGVTIASELNPEYPEQFKDQSYGLTSGETVLAPLVADNAAIKVLVPNNAGELASNWNTLGYTPGSNWTSGIGGVGYDATGGYDDYFQIDLKSQMYGPNGNGSAFTRQLFTVEDVSAIDSLTLNVRYEDGFIAYLNGVEIIRRNAPTSPAWNSVSSTYHIDTEGIIFEPFDLSSYIGQLVDGDNILAVHAMNDSINNSKFWIHTTLDAMVSSQINEQAYRYLFSPTPGSENSLATALIAEDVVFTVEHGFFDGPISLELSTPTLGATIYYTTNASSPTIEDGILYSGAIDITTTTTIRATAFKTGYDPSVVMTQTYIYLSDVASQDAPSYYPPDWGFDTNFPGGRIPVDYWMDPEVLNDPSYAGLLETALTSLPTMSIVIDVDDMFDEQTGIYANPLMTVGANGEEWQKLASIEYFDPNNVEEGFQINAGIRIQGGASRAPRSSPKHSMRLTFTSDFGPTKLDYPLFGDNAAASFDQIILRAGYGHSWLHSNTFHADERGQAQYIKDEFARQTQLAMGQPAIHGKHVQLYINGIYWGIYNPTERANADFAASYFGGDKDDYDALNAGEAIDGDDVAWQQLLALSDKDLSIEYNYRAVEAMLDIDNFIDFNILNIWAGNDDWDTDWTGNLPGHNWYATRDRNDGKYTFYNWDSEHFFCDNSGLYIDLTNGGENENMSGMYRSLMANEEYRIRFADRLQKHFFNGGSLTSESVIERYSALADGMYDAIVAESARWGDWRRDVYRRGGPFVLYTRDDYWIPQRDELLDDYFPYRSDIVLQQYKARGLYPDVDAPSFNQHGGAVSSGFDLTMTASEGTIYYTTDGADPRNSGGSVSSSAIVYTGAVDLTTSRYIQARVLAGDGQWSALNEATFTVDDSIVAIQQGLRISELMYNPISGNDTLEFIEFTNIGSTTLDLTGVAITNGVTFAFDDEFTLEPGDHTLVVSFDHTILPPEYAVFILNYSLDLSVSIAGQYSGTLSNGGETIRVEAIDGSPVVEFTYDDTGNWPGRADGAGSSLEIVDPAEDSDDADNWRSSVDYNGSPGATGTQPLDSVVINEVLSNPSGNDVDTIELHNISDSPVDVGGWYLSDSNGNYLKYQIAGGSVIAAGEYLLLDESDFNPTPLTPGDNDFALNAPHGDDVYLTIGNGAGLPLYFVDHIDFGPAANGVSFGRYPNGDGRVYAMAEKTLGEENSYPAVGPVLISELMYHTVGNDDGLEFIELYNTTSSLIDITGWRLDSGVTFELPLGTSIAANSTIVIVPFELTDTTAINHFLANYTLTPGATMAGGYDGKLCNDGEKVELLRPDDPPVGEPGYTPYILVDVVRYNDASPWPAAADGLGQTLNRLADDVYGDDAGSWQELLPTPGSINFDTRLPGDANNDGMVGLLDLDILGQNYGISSGATWAMADFNGDGAVGLLDLDILGSHYGDTAMTVGGTNQSAMFWLLDDNGDDDEAAFNLLGELGDLGASEQEIVRLF